MIVLYFALDIMVTIADAILLSCIVTSLCKRRGRKIFCVYGENLL